MLKSLRRFLLLISFIYPLLIEVFSRQMFSTSQISPHRKPFFIGYVAGKPNTNIADSQYRASLGFFLYYLIKVKKALS